MNKPLVLITDCDHPDTEAEHAIFDAAGLDVRLANCTSEGDVLAAGAEAVALLASTPPSAPGSSRGCQIAGSSGATGRVSTP